jgi:hypothetical protein
MAVITVSLTHRELRQAMSFAQRLRAASGRRRHRRNYASAKVGETIVLSRELNGACGHRAICKALNRPWRPNVNAYHDPDIPPDIGARARFPHPEGQWNADLCVRPVDPDHHRYVLAVGRFTEWEVVGWCWGWEAKQDPWVGLSGGSRVWYVPRSALHDVAELVLP